MDVTQAFKVRGMNDGVSNWSDPRAIGLSRYDSTTFIGPGIYPVRFPGVYSDGLSLSADPALVKAARVCSADSLSAAYYFRVGADCNQNDEDDQVDPAPGACKGGCGDFNQDGDVTVLDIFNYLSAWFGTCDGTQSTSVCPYGSADFNHDGSITVTDIFNFLTAWFAGPNACH
jgi:hypothetical protein